MTTTTAAPFAPPGRVAPCAFGEERTTYRITGRGTARNESYFPDPERRSFLKIQTGRDLPRPFPYRFNAAVRRQPGLVNYGDLPGGVLAELEALPENKPPFLARGEVRLRRRHCCRPRPCARRAERRGRGGRHEPRPPSAECGVDEFTSFRKQHVKRRNNCNR